MRDLEEFCSAQRVSKAREKSTPKRAHDEDSGDVEDCVSDATTLQEKSLTQG